MAIDPAPGDDVVYFGEYLAVIRRRKWWVIVCVVLGLVVAAVYYKTATRYYDSTARIQATVVLPIQQAAAAKVDLSTEESLVTSNDVTKCAELLAKDPTFKKDPTATTVDPNTVCTSRALASAPLDRSPLQDITTTVVPQSTVFTIQFSSRTPKLAQLGAQSFALAYVQVKSASAQSQLDQLRAPLLARQDDLTKSEAKVSTQISDLIAKIASTQPGTQTKAAANQAKLASLEAERTGDQNALNTVSQQLLALDP